MARGDGGDARVFYGEIPCMRGVSARQRDHMAHARPEASGEVLSGTWGCFQIAARSCAIGDTIRTFPETMSSGLGSCLMLCMNALMDSTRSDFSVPPYYDYCQCLG